MLLPLLASWNCEKKRPIVGEGVGCAVDGAGVPGKGVGTGVGDAVGGGGHTTLEQSVVVVHVAGVVTWSVSVHSHVPLNESSNAAPVVSPQHVSVARVSSPFCVSMPDDVPHTGQFEPGSVAEKRPIWSTMSADVAVVWSALAMSAWKSSPLNDTSG